MVSSVALRFLSCFFFSSTRKEFTVFFCLFFLCMCFMKVIGSNYSYEFAISH